MPKGLLIFLSLGDPSSLLFKSRESRQWPAFINKTRPPVGMCALQHVAVNKAMGVVTPIILIHTADESHDLSREPNQRTALVLGGTQGRLLLFNSYGAKLEAAMPNPQSTAKIVGHPGFRLRVRGFS